MNRFLLSIALLVLTALANAQSAPARVHMKTSLGDVVIELNEQAAPATCANFLQYVDEGFYSNTLFHRVIPDFMVQGGGFESGMAEKPTRPPVRNESNNGLVNERGTIAMARTAQPDSATAQFFINVVDNAYLNGSPARPGYTVFGKVLQGMDVIDRIAQVETVNRGPFQNVPAADVLILSITREQPATVVADPASAKPVAPIAAPALK